jgi:hypothetical protein
MQTPNPLFGAHIMILMFFFGVARQQGQRHFDSSSMVLIVCKKCVGGVAISRRDPEDFMQNSEPGSAHHAFFVEVFSCTEKKELDVLAEIDVAIIHF